MYQSLIQGLVQQAIEVILDDIPQPTTYTVTTTTDYDPVTGSNIRVVGTYTFKSVCAKFKTDELDGSVDIRTDMKLIVPYLSLPVEPTQDDTCTVMGRTWTVQRNMAPPGSSIWIIHVRAS